MSAPSGMHDVMAGHVERGDVPGVVTLVSRRGETHVDAIGAAAFGGSPIRRDTIFRISSLTKPIVAAATMILVAEHRLELDDPVDPLLPELAGRRSSGAWTVRSTTPCRRTGRSRCAIC